MVQESIKIADYVVNPGEKLVVEHTITIKGDEVTFPLFVINGEKPGPRLAVTAGIHGAEYASVAAALQVGQNITPDQLSGQLIIVPVANMPAFKARSIYICPLDGINLKVPQGCVYGLLGRNGAGKTTIIRILMGQDSPTRGQSFIIGENSNNLSVETHGRIGYVAEGHNLIQHYKVSRLIKLCKDLSLHWNDDFFERLIDIFRLPPDRRIRELSIGMRAQLNLALAMAIEPELLILDDPTLGLDTVARRQFLELAIEIIQKQGRTILFSSHILSDVERIAERIGILAAGRLVIDCPLEELKERVKKMRVIFPESAPANLYLTEIVNQQVRGREMILTVANWNKQKQTALETFKPSSCTEIPMSLEDIFIECTKPDQQAVTVGAQEI